MDDQLSLLLRREGLGQDCRRRWFGCSLKEVSDFSTSWTILRVMIITTDKARVSWFALIPIFNRRSFSLLCLIIIFALLILTSPLFRFILTGRGRFILTLEEVDLGVVLETECEWTWVVPITPSAACEAAGVIEVLEVPGRGNLGSKS
jgi:hypothetical protein